MAGCSQVLGVAAATDVWFLIIMVPHPYRLHITLQLLVGDGHLDVVANVGLVHLHIVERMDASLLPIRMDTIEIQVDSIGFVQSPQYMDKAEREQFALGFLERLRQSRHTHAKSHHIIFFIDHKADKIRIDK